MAALMAASTGIDGECQDSTEVELQWRNGRHLGSRICAQPLCQVGNEFFQPAERFRRWMQYCLTAAAMVIYSRVTKLADGKDAR